MNDVMQIRRRRACVAVLAVIAALFAACFVSSVLEQEACSERAYADDVWASIRSGYTIEDALDHAGFVRASDEDIPAWFCEEVLVSAKRYAIYPTSDWSVVYICGMNGNSQELTLGSFTERAESSGWNVIESGESDIATYVKERGICRWMMAAYVRSQEGDSLVLHIQHS